MVIQIIGGRSNFDWIPTNRRKSLGAYWPIIWAHKAFLRKQNSWTGVLLIEDFSTRHQLRVKFSLIMVAVCIVIWVLLLCRPPPGLVHILHQRWRLVFTWWRFSALLKDSFSFACTPESQAGRPKDNDDGNYPDNVSDYSVHNSARVVDVYVFWMAVIPEAELLNTRVDKRVKVDQRKRYDDRPHVFQCRWHTICLFAPRCQVFHRFS